MPVRIGRVERHVTATVAAMTRWEHKQAILFWDLDKGGAPLYRQNQVWDVESWLGSFGTDGWELVSVFSVSSPYSRTETYTFKRPAETPPAELR